MANVYFKVGTQEKFDALAMKDQYTLYWIHDTQRLYKGDVLYSIGTPATHLFAGLMSAEDKIKLDKLIEGGIGTIVSPDNSLTIEDIEGSGKSVKVKLSDIPNNYLKLREDGLYVNLPTASAEVAGVVKLHDNFGTDVQGTITQNAITNEMKDKVEMDVIPEEETLVLGYDIDNSMGLKK